MKSMEFTIATTEIPTKRSMVMQCVIIATTSKLLAISFELSSNIMVDRTRIEDQTWYSALPTAAHLGWPSENW